MKQVKNILKIFIAAVLLVSVSACSVNRASVEWVAKYKNITVPADVYLYYLNDAYDSAKGYLPARSDVFSQKIEGQDAKTWMEETALKNVKVYLAMNKLKDDWNLKPYNGPQLHTTQEDEDDITEMIWKDDEKLYKKCGISKNAVRMASAKYDTLYEMVTFRLDNKVLKDKRPTVRDFYERHYLDFTYIWAPLYHYNKENKSYTPFSQAEKKKVIRQMKGYASKINAGSLTFDQAAKDYYMSIKDRPDILVKARYTPWRRQDMLKKGSYFQFGLITEQDALVKAMKIGEAKIDVAYDDSIEQDCFLYQRNDTRGKTDAQIAAIQDEDNIMLERDEYGDNEYIRQQANQLTGVTVNQKVIDEYSPKMFQDAQK